MKKKPEVKQEMVETKPKDFNPVLENINEDCGTFLGQFCVVNTIRKTWENKSEIQCALIRGVCTNCLVSQEFTKKLIKGE
jgi:hypothetical protein